MNSLRVPLTDKEMITEISKLETKIQQYQTQINKNREVLKKMLTEAEGLPPNDERKQQLVQQIEASMKFNKKFIKAMEKAKELATLSKDSLAEAPTLYTAAKVPTSKPKFTSSNRKNGGKSKKSRKTKKGRKGSGKFLNLFTRKKKTQKNPCKNPYSLTLDKVTNELITCGELERREKARVKLDALKARLTNPEYKKQIVTTAFDIN